MWNKISKTIKISVLTVLMVVFSFGAAMAFHQPALNLGMTNILDAVIPPPGVYLETYMYWYNSDELRDGDGDKLPLHNEVTTTVVMPQLAWFPEKKLTDNLGFGVQILMPVVNINMDSDLGMTANNDSLGDFCIGPIIYGTPINLGNDFQLHWFVEFDTYCPTGSYDKNNTVNPSSNHWTFEPWASFTLMMPHGFSFSTRQHFTYHTTNDDYLLPDGKTHDLQPGMCYHFNYSLMKTVDFISPSLRVGLVGYYEKQLTEDELDDHDMSDSKEQVFAIGPAIHYITKGGVVVSLKSYFESEVENRGEGTAIVGRIIFPF